MQVNVEQISPVLVELNIQIDAERVTREYEKAFSNVVKKSKIKGFRPGKAPRNVVRRVYGPRLDADVIQTLIDETFPKATAEQQMQPVSQPSLEPQSLVSGQPFSYKARVEVLPKIDSVTYEGLEAKRPKVDVPEERVAEELESIRRANSTLEKVEGRAVKDGDVVTCDLSASVDGEEVADAGTKGFPIEVGQGQVFPELEAALRGATSGETKTCEVEMPEGHPHPKLAGKKVQFSVTLGDVKERVLPEADDDLAKDLGDFETLAQLKESIKEQLAAREKEQADNVLAERLVKALVEANPVPLPPSLVNQQMRMSEQEIVMRARSQGQQVTGVGDELREKIKEDSETKVRAGLIMAEIAKKESIQIGPEQIEEGLQELAQQTGKNVAKLRVEYSEPQRREMLVGMILENKVLDLIESKAKITDE